MAEQTETIIADFTASSPTLGSRPADRSTDGMLPMRGYRYCEAVAAASAFGWYIYPPLASACVGQRRLRGLMRAPRIGTRCGALSFRGFDSCSSEAPDPVKPLAPPFLAVSREPGVVQI
jgi:hypothetical protein